MPYLQDWNEKYAGDGFTIVGVHAPEFEFEKRTENVIEAAAELGVVWPIAQDNDFRTWRSYENRYWPAKYLVDANGIIRFTHFGEGAYDETEHHIRTLMEEAGHDVPDVTVGREEWKPILGTTVLRAGTQRVAFLLASGSALVRVPEATVTTTFLNGNAAGETATARFHEWPFGTRGSYVTRLTFPQAGTWRLDIEGDGGGATLDVQVDETSIVRDIGQIGIFSNTKTLDSAGGDIGSITSHYRPDPALYEITVAESLFSGRPSVVVFASPAFCTTATCGPQVETVTELREAYPDAADYIHVEVYDNPHEIQGDLTKGVLSPVLAEWGIDQVEHYRNESWTFIIGADARIAERFEGYATFDELEEALQAALGGA